MVVWLCLSSLLAEPLPLAAAITNKSTNSPTNPLNKSIFSSFLSISSIHQRWNEWNGEKRERAGHQFFKSSHFFQRFSQLLPLLRHQPSAFTILHPAHSEEPEWKELLNCWMAWRGYKSFVSLIKTIPFHSINFIHSIVLLYSPQLLYPCTVIILSLFIHQTIQELFNFISQRKKVKFIYCWLWGCPSPWLLPP